MDACETVIIGGGAVGASIAYRLACAGTEVTLIDKGALCSGTSGATFAWVGAHGQRPHFYYQLRRASLSLYPDLSREIGSDIQYKAQGSLSVVRDFKELEAATLPRILNQVDIALINTNYALEAGLNPTEDALVIEGSDSPYVNILVARPDNKDSEAMQKLAEVLNSEQVKAFIKDSYEGAVVPAF